MMKKRFKKIYVEITNVCNLSCAFCPPTRRSPHFMSPDAFNQLLERIRPWTDYIYLHVKGEPLLHPDLEALLKMARGMGFYVNLTTNGTLLGKTADTLLANPPRQINISLHSFEANALKGQTFDEYIMSTLDFAKKYSPDCGITCFRLWNLDPEKVSAPQREKNLLILTRLKEAFQFDGSLEHRDFCGCPNGSRKNICMADKTYLSFDHEFQWPSLIAQDFGPAGTCRGLKDHLAILCDGTVVPCCLDGDGVIPLGNIFQTPLGDILDSPRARAMLTAFQSHSICEPLCRRCGYRTRF